MRLLTGRASMAAMRRPSIGNKREDGKLLFERDALLEFRKFFGAYLGNPKNKVIGKTFAKHTLGAQERTLFFALFYTFFYSFSFAFLQSSPQNFLVKRGLFKCGKT
jgi:hypothetical protein